MYNVYQRLSEVAATHSKVQGVQSITTKFCQRDIRKVLTVLELKNGLVYIETSVTDDDDVETIELLYSNDRKNFRLINRVRLGDAHHEFKSYDRDLKYPIDCNVRLG